MESKNLPAVTSPALPAATKDLTTVQVGWLALADMKVKTFDILTKGELEVQALLNTIKDEKDLPKIQERLKKAKEVAAEKKEVRLHLTNTIKVKLFDKAMEFEKRNDELIKTGEEWELERRKEVVAEQDKAKALQKEKDAYEAHIKNEYLRIRTAYIIKLEKRIMFYYNQALSESKKKMTKAALATYIEDIKKELPNIELEKAVKFQRSLISKDDALAIIAKIPPFDPQVELNKALANVDHQFGMYNEDFKNKETAKQKAEEAVQLIEETLNEELATEVSINTLVATADSISYAGGPEIKKKVTIVEENTYEWMILIMTNFIKYKEECKPFIKVQTIGNLKLSQMAAALAKTGKTFSGLKTKEEEK